MDGAAFTLRPARADEAARLTEIALESKAHWGYPAEWIEAWREELTVAVDYVAAHRVVVAEDAGGELLGFYGLRFEGEPCDLDLLYVLPAAIGRGVGGALIGDAIAAARAAGEKAMTIDADPHAAGFYERMGAVRYGEIPASMDGTPRVRPQYRVALAGP